MAKRFPGGYNYLQISKPGLNIPLDAHMVQPEYVSIEVNVLHLSKECAGWNWIEFCNELTRDLKLKVT